MCRAFSCIIDREKTVTWKFGIDSHDSLLKIAGIKDDTIDPNLIKFCRVEIAPENNDYLNPDKWQFKIDMDVIPKWWTLAHKKACMKAHEEWKNQLYKILVRKAIVHPFKITPPKKITQKHIDLLKEWASVGASVWDSVGASVWDSVGASVWDSVGAYAGTFFLLPRDAWKYTENVKTDEYPFLPLIKLWEQGLVPSFDGKKWRLHGGEDAKTLWEGELK